MIDYEMRKDEVQKEIKRLENMLKVTKKEHLKEKIQREINDYKTSLVSIKLAKEHLHFEKLFEI